MTQAELHYEKSADYTKLKVKEEPNDYNEQNQNGRSNLLKRIPLERLMDLKVDYACQLPTTYQPSGLIEVGA